MSNKRLYKSSVNRMLCGVCGGIAEYFDIDPTLVRLVWVIITFMGGAGILAYGAAIGGAITAIKWLLMLEDRLTSSVISGKVSTRTLLIAVSTTAILFTLIAIFTPKIAGI